MKNSKKVGSFRAVPVKSIGVVGEGAVDFTEMEEALVLGKQKLSAHPDLLQKVDEEFEKGRIIWGCSSKIYRGCGGRGSRLYGDRGSPGISEKEKNRNYQLTQTSCRRWMKNLKKVRTFRAVPVKSIGVVGEGAVDFMEIEEAWYY